MKKIITLLRTGPALIGEVRGAKPETAKRFDKSDKNAPPIEFGMFKINIEQLADGSPVMVSVFLDAGTKAEDFAAKAQLKPRRCHRGGGEQNGAQERRSSRNLWGKRVFRTG